MTSRFDSVWFELLDRARSGDKSALGRVVERYRDYLSLLVRLRLDSRLRTKVSESDIVQQSLYEAVRDFDTYRGGSEPELAAWLRRILARNLADAVRMYYQSQKRDMRLEQSIERDLDQSSEALEHALISRTPSPSQQASERERAILLSDALARLPDSYREVVIRRHLEGKPFPVIAREMERSLDSVKNLWFRAFDRLRQLLKETS